MKRITFFATIVLACVVAYFVISCKEPDGRDGILFYEGSWEQALQKAKTDQKPIFIDIYATWCGPCKMLKKKTFPSKEAGDYFNANYICLSYDGENGEGITMAEKYHITAYPTLIILNKNGDLINMQAGYMTPSELVAYGKRFYTK